MSASSIDSWLELSQRPLEELMGEAACLRDEGKGRVLTYSPKVFIPLTELCRDVCHYCTFAKTPRRLTRAYLSPEQVLDIARRGAERGCREALFTLGDKPELRYRAAREALNELGYASTLDYLEAMAQLVLEETGLLPHLNPGVLELADYQRLRRVAPSMGIMLESSSARLSRRGGPHFGSPDKDPQVRLASIRDAGRAGVPLTSGILIGIGENRAERLQSLLDLKAMHEEFDHLQEIIVQNFLPKRGTLMAKVPAAAEDELLWTVAMARLIFGPHMNLQVPPNLNEGRLAPIVQAGINDWGGVSPVTPDHVNPEAPWPAVEKLERASLALGHQLVARLTIYPEFLGDPERWLSPEMRSAVLHNQDSEGYAREDDWSPGEGDAPAPRTRHGPVSPVTGLAERMAQGRNPTESEISTLFQARGTEVDDICRIADQLRQDRCGEVVSWTVNRNINYTNVCGFHCSFCAFSKGPTHDDLRGKPYVLDLDEIGRRSAEAWERGATEVCLQGGIHPAYTGDTYLEICSAIRTAAPEIHIHAFSPLEVTHGAKSLGISVASFLARLREAGLSTLPGTAAEILDDEIRRIICPDKLTTDEWLNVIRTAHEQGLRTTSTIMFGHVEGPVHWARHLLRLRNLAEKTGGITEFVPLPFVHMEAPMFRRGLSRKGPTFRETLLMHAVSRIVLDPLITNIQASWVKLGPVGIARALDAGVNDLGGTLMNESISRAAGSAFGQELPPQEMQAIIRAAGRVPRQRDTLYRDVSASRIRAALEAAPLTPVFNRPAREYQAAS